MTAAQMLVCIGYPLLIIAAAVAVWWQTTQPAHHDVSEEDNR